MEPRMVPTRRIVGAPEAGAEAPPSFTAGGATALGARDTPGAGAAALSARGAPPALTFRWGIWGVLRVQGPNALARCRPIQMTCPPTAWRALTPRPTPKSISFPVPTPWPAPTSWRDTRACGRQTACPHVILFVLLHTRPRESAKVAVPITLFEGRRRGCRWPWRPVGVCNRPVAVWPQLQHTGPE